MFERFTDRSRRVMAMANQAAIRLGHPMIDTEHILLGLVQEGTGVAANVLKPMVGGDLTKVRQEVGKLMPAKGQLLPRGKLPQTNEAKTAIMFAIEEAKSLHHGYVGTEHLLLGIMRQNDGVAGRAISNLGLKIDVVRIAIVEILRSGAVPPIAKNEPQLSEPSTTRTKPWWRF